jgi:hypothetical protein
MRRFTHILTALAVLGSGVATFSAPAEAQSYRQQQRYVERFCARNPGARDCREFRRDASRWDNRRYQRWYRDNYRDDRRDATAAAIFGLAAGAALGAAASSSGNSQAARCAQRYRTYDPRTNTYVANSAGERRVCRL